MNTCRTCSTLPSPSVSRSPVPIPRPLTLGLLLLSVAPLCQAQRSAAPTKSHLAAAAVHQRRPGFPLLTLSTGHSSSAHGWRSLFTSDGSSAPHHGEGLHPGDGLPVNEALDWYKRARSFRHITALPRRQNLGLLASTAPARDPSGSLVPSARAAMQPENHPSSFVQRLGKALPEWLAW